MFVHKLLSRAFILRTTNSVCFEFRQICVSSKRILTSVLIFLPLFYLLKQNLIAWILSSLFTKKMELACTILLLTPSVLTETLLCVSVTLLLHMKHSNLKTTMSSLISLTIGWGQKHQDSMRRRSHEHYPVNIGFHSCKAFRLHQGPIQ